MHIPNTSMFVLEVNAEQHSFEVNQANKLPATGRAVGFLRALKDTLQSREITLQPSQYQQVLEAIEVIRERALSKSPWLYRLQARFNPWSNAYQIESLCKKIVALTQEKNSSLVQSFSNNFDNPYAFFAVPENVLNHLKQDTRHPVPTVHNRELNWEKSRVLYYLDPEDFDSDEPSETKGRFIYQVCSIPENRGLALPIVVEFDPSENFVKVDKSYMEGTDRLNGPHYTADEVERKEIAEHLQRCLMLNRIR